MERGSKLAELGAIISQDPVPPAESKKTFQQLP